MTQRGSQQLVVCSFNRRRASVCLAKNSDLKDPSTLVDPLLATRVVKESDHKHPAMLTLEQRCLQILQRYREHIEDVGGMPMHLIDTVLESCSARDLLRIEQATRYPDFQLLECTTKDFYLLSRVESFVGLEVVEA